jgi:hypothetical protein
VEELADEAANAAQSILTMCIRAFEYLPAMDITFGNFLRAPITADRDLLGGDGASQRRVMIEAFRRRGIYPDGVVSLSESALCWEEVAGDGFTAMPAGEISDQLLIGAEDFHPRRRQRGGSDMPELESPEAAPELPDDDDPEAGNRIAPLLQHWAWENAARLELSRNPLWPIVVQGFHAAFRVAPSGRLVVEVVARFTQQDRETENDPQYGGLRFRGARRSSRQRAATCGLSSPSRLTRASAASDSSKFVSARDEVDAALDWARRRVRHAAHRSPELPRTPRRAGDLMTLATDRNHITIRMYNVGFGDAFLIVFPGDERPRRVLVDCGTHAA